jgi:NADH:ubiquinone oxidoreductase subunit 2 (subunit N)
LCLAHPSVRNPNQFNFIPKINLLLISFLLLSLRGLPPLTGFLPKWILLKYLSLKFQVLILFLLLGSYLNLYFYLTVVFSSIITPRNHNQPRVIRPPLLTIAATSCLGLIILSYALTFFY